MLPLLARLASDRKWLFAFLLLLACAVAVVLIPGPRRHSIPPPPPDPATVQTAVHPIEPNARPASDDLLDYTVQENDTVATIAHLFVIREEDLRSVNGWAAGEELEPGMRIKIPPSAM